MSRRALLLLLPALLIAAPARADELRWKDGRTIQGEVTAETDAEVELSARMGGGHVTMRVPRSEIAEVVRAPLPAEYFQDPVGEARQGKAAVTPGSYLVVPVQGAFGKDVLAKALQRVLAYAVRNRVQHVVLLVDSQGAHDLDEARAVYKLLSKYEDQLLLHALVRRATGDALAAVLPCHTFHVHPQASVGGAKPGAEGEEAAEQAALRAGLAARAAEGMRARGRPGTLIGAMLDPAIPLAAWLVDGKWTAGPAVPEGVAAEAVVFQKPAGEPLVLDGAMLKRLGIPQLEGGPAELGAALGVEGWAEESDYGQKTMSKLAAEAQAAAEKSAASYAAKVEKAVARRAGLVDALQHALEQASHWDPEGGTYYTHQRSQSWGWGQWGSYGTSSETNILTPDSRKEWQQRTDLSIGYLTTALNTLDPLRSAERRCAKLNVAPAIPAEQLERLEKDLKLRRKFLAENRDKKMR